MLKSGYRVFWGELCVLLDLLVLIDISSELKITLTMQKVSSFHCNHLVNKYNHTSKLRSCYSQTLAIEIVFPVILRMYSLAVL